MKDPRIAGLALLMIALPGAAFAQSSSGTSLSSLLAQITALEQQIAALGGGGATTSAPAATAASAAPMGTPASQSLCPDLSRTLSLGSVGPDVGGLQTFLAEEGVFSAVASGYFGSLTEAAVAAWQERHGIVSGGDATSTGLGVVGPKTRAAMESGCLPGRSSVPSHGQCIAVLPPTTECPVSWQPVIDQNGCTMYYKCSIPLPALQSSTSTATTTGGATCPVVQKPVCSGTVAPFQTDANGCITSYLCSL